MMLRIGLLMRKVGCSSIFDDGSLSYKAVTLLSLEESSVLSIQGGKNDALVQVGFGAVKSSKLNKPQRQMFFKLGAECKKRIIGFKVSLDYASKLELLQSFSLSHFKVGQYVDAVGKSIGKGFAGVMKRHSFRGLSASHGVSISHRSHGSTGQCQDPGRVFKGKKMAGHLGGKRITTQNLKVMHIDLEKRLLAVGGSVPGPEGGSVLLRDAIKKFFLVE